MSVAPPAPWATCSPAHGRLLEAAGIGADEAAVDVDLYARRILGWDRARVLTSRTDPAPAALEPAFSTWIARRAQREPSAYIVGHREFYGRDFDVSPAVLIPRPETEHIIDAALPLLASQPNALVADLGTGSGNIAVTLACEARGCRVLATDVSAEALEVAGRNASRHGVADRVTFLCTSYLDGVDGTFDIIAANPPYVRDGDGPACRRRCGASRPSRCLAAPTACAGSSPCSMRPWCTCARRGGC